MKNNHVVMLEFNTIVTKSEIMRCFMIEFASNLQTSNSASIVNFSNLENDQFIPNDVDLQRNAMLLQDSDTEEYLVDVTKNKSKNSGSGSDSSSSPKLAKPETISMDI